MIPDVEPLGRYLAEIAAELGEAREFVVAFSGGVDSTVLLSLLAELKDRPPLRAVHVDHQLQPESRQWATTCAATASELGVPLKLVRVKPEQYVGRGPEAAAREARYAALRSGLKKGSWLFSGHHLDDQVETLLLNLLRGSGPDGLAAMPAARKLGDGWLLRPFLAMATTRAELLRSATRRGLSWIDDPSNDELDADRNYLRHKVLPVLKGRWPSVVEKLAVSVERAAETRQLLAEMAKMDLARAGAPARLSVSELNAMSRARQRNLLRTALRALELPLPPRRALDAVIADVLPARMDAMPQVAWEGAEIRRSGDHLYLMAPLAPAPTEEIAFVEPQIELPAGLGILSLTGAAEALAAASSAPLSIRWRLGGERLRLRGRRRSLKTLFNETGVVPWMRSRIPLVFLADELLAVGDLMRADDDGPLTGLDLKWKGRPPLG